MYDIKTQDLMPLVEEYRKLRLEANQVTVQVEEARETYRLAQDKLDRLNAELAVINATINYCVDNDTDPVHAKLVLSTSSQTSQAAHASGLGKLAATYKISKYIDEYKCRL